MSGEISGRKSGPKAVIGFAIVSEDGMLADANGVMPDSLKFNADERYFIDGMNRVQVAINGRHSQEPHPNAPRRPRITVSNRVKAIEPDPRNAKGILWNPAGAPFAKAWETLGVSDATLGVVGATFVFAMFLDSYDEFHLTRGPKVRLPGGRPVFPGVPAQTPEQILAQHGLTPGPPQVLDAANGITVTVWRRN
jgi:dihydrofolate reductase